MGVFREVRQIVNLLSGEAFCFRGARIHNRTGKPVRLEVETDEYEIRKIREEKSPQEATLIGDLPHNERQMQQAILDKGDRGEPLRRGG
jgi:hypothetical protein